MAVKNTVLREIEIYILYYYNLLEWVYVYFYTKTNTHNAVLKSPLCEWH